jgi:anti-sigma factor RsiW
MTPCPWSGERIDAYVDGTATATERAEMERHLATCPDCRAEADAIARLVRRARGLPVSLEPSADGWTALRGTLHPRSSWDRVRARGVLRIAAAIVLAAGLSSALTVFVMQRSASPDHTRATADAAASFARVERDYVEVSRDLAAAVAARRASLSPEAWASLERSLTTIDRAIAEARAALAEDPGNALVVQLLTASYERKLDLLRRAARLSTES